MSSRAWSGNSAIFVVGDESDADGEPTTAGTTFGGGLSPAVVISRLGPRHYADSTPYNHYSLLATIEQSWHLGYLGHAGDVAGGVVPMNDLLVHQGNRPGSRRPGAGPRPHPDPPSVS